MLATPLTLRASAVGRVHVFLEEMDEVLRNSGEDAARDRFAAARKTSRLEKDLREVNERRSWLSGAFPEVCIEEGPLLSLVRSWLSEVDDNPLDDPAALQLERFLGEKASD